MGTNPKKNQDVGSEISITQFTELYNQITLAIKQKGADPRETATKLIRENILGEATGNFLDEKAKKNGVKIKTPIKTTHSEQLFVTDKIFVGGGKVASSQTIFPVYLSPDFTKGMEENQKISKREMLVFEQIKDADFVDLFLSLNKDVTKLVMTKQEIIDFCDKHAGKLRKGLYSTFFVYEENGSFFVADVRFDSGGLKLFVFDFSNAIVWNAKCANRLVVPATALKHLGA